MTTLLQDVRFALRMLLKSPAFALIAIVTLAIGIGANTALFSVVNGVLLNPLPYAQSGQLVAINERNGAQSQAPISYLNFLDWQSRNKTFSSMAMYRHEDYNLTGHGAALRVNGFMISAQFLSTLEVHPAWGRDFNLNDDRLGAAPVALLSDGFWHRRFGGSPEILGHPIDLNGTAFTVVGILPPDFLFYGTDRDVFIPLGQWNDPSFRDRRIDESAHAIGRLLPGVTLAQARGDMDRIAHNLSVLYPEADKDVGISLVSMKQDIVGNVQPFLLVLLAAVGFLLLIACANVASLLLARSMARSGEFALRSALGAGRTRLIRQLLTESTLLAATGGLLGLALAWIATKAIVAALPAELPRATEVSLDTRVLLFTLAVSLLAGIVFGLAPLSKLPAPICRMFCAPQAAAPAACVIASRDSSSPSRSPWPSSSSLERASCFAPSPLSGASIPATSPTTPSPSPSLCPPIPKPPLRKLAPASASSKPPCVPSPE
jgi:predicted permease